MTYYPKFTLPNHDPETVAALDTSDGDAWELSAVLDACAVHGATARLCDAAGWTRGHVDDTGGYRLE